MQYDRSFKKEILKLSHEIEIKVAAAQLNILFYTPFGSLNNRNNTERICIAEPVISGCLYLLPNITKNDSFPCIPSHFVCRCPVERLLFQCCKSYLSGILIAVIHTAQTLIHSGFGQYSHPCSSMIRRIPALILFAEVFATH